MSAAARRTRSLAAAPPSVVRSIAALRDAVAAWRRADSSIGIVPTMVETPHWETDYTVTPSPHHPIGAKGVAESPHVGSIPCFSSAVTDAFAHVGETHLTMPHTAFNVWKTIHKHGLDAR